MDIYKEFVIQFNSSIEQICTEFKNNGDIELREM